MLWRLWLLVGSDRQTDQGTMSPIELFWTAKKAFPNQLYISCISREYGKPIWFGLDTPFVLKPAFVQTFKQLGQKHNPIIQQQSDQSIARSLDLARFRFIFSRSISRLWKKISRSSLELWDVQKKILFSSRTPRFREQNSCSRLELWDLENKILVLVSSSET